MDLLRPRATAQAPAERLGCAATAQRSYGNTCRTGPTCFGRSCSSSSPELFISPREAPPVTSDQSRVPTRAARRSIHGRERGQEAVAGVRDQDEDAPVLPQFLPDGAPRVLLLASWVMALYSAGYYAAFAAFNLGDHSPCCLCQQQPSVPFLRCYQLTGPGAVDAARALKRELLWCSAPQAAAAALALAMLLTGTGRGRRRSRGRAAAFVALAAAAARHHMYARILGLAGVGAPPGDFLLAAEIAAVFVAVALDLLGFLALLLGDAE
ncbi:hypothetical protein ACP70R_026710 [Stipagrostis hirtigluma subsp. patula]